MENISFHGTSISNAMKIVGRPNKVNINVGRGELGKGFYTGTSIALAAIWAHAKHKEDGVVIKFQIEESEFVKLNGHVIKKRSRLKELWNLLIAEKKTLTHVFGYDYIISPFATIEETGSQLKFESTLSETVLNKSNATIL